MTHLLCFDLDGTLVDPWTQGPPPALLWTYLDLLEEAGAATVIATGRSLPQTLAALRASCPDLVPRFIITRDYEIHVATGTGAWQRLAFWDALAEARHREARAAYQWVLDELRRYASEHTSASFVSVDEGFGDFLGKSYEDVLRLCGFIERFRERAPLLQYYCNNLHVRLGHVAFNKGSALTELSRSLRIEPRNVFAAGDNHNDLPMLNGGPAHRIACPGNAVPIVKAAVRQRLGFVATLPAGAGLVEALHYFFFRG